jgi:hypothetical protein
MKERPYITIYRTWVPKEVVDCRKAGWYKEGGITYAETYEFSKKVAKRHITKGVVVMDLLDFKLIKNNTGIDDRETSKFFVQRYDQEIARFVDQFLIRDEDEQNSNN